MITALNGMTIEVIHTYTEGCMRSLFANSPKLAHEVAEAGHFSGERVLVFPDANDYDSALAGYFLKNFNRPAAQPVCWASA